MTRALLPILLAIFVALPARAAPFASLRSDKVYLRQGPTARYPVLFVYRRKDYPLEVLASYEDWRRVRDVDGTVGWISQTMLSDIRTVLVTGQGRAQLRSSPYGTAASVVALLEPGVVARLKACQPRSCQVIAGGTTGWIDKKRIWGVRAGEVFH